MFAFRELVLVADLLAAVMECNRQLGLLDGLPVERAASRAQAAVRGRVCGNETLARSAAQEMPARKQRTTSEKSMAGTFI